MSRKQSLNPKQRRYDPLAVLAYVARYKQNHAQRSPSERQIQAALGISAPSVVHTILGRLEQSELLAITRYGRGRASDLTLTTAGEAAVQQWQEVHHLDDPSSSGERG